MAEEVVVDEATPQEGEVQELELGPEGTVEEEEGVVTLPSDEGEFVMPEKFEGKTVEEIAKSYLELEKFKGGKPNEPAEVETPAEVEEPKGDQYIEEFLQSGKLSEESYAALEAEGKTRADIDDKMEFEAYKSKKTVDELVEVIGGIDNFTAMDEWAKAEFEPEVMTQYSKELAGASKFAKQAILKDLYGQYNESQNGITPTSDVIHTNEPQAKVGRGYTSQHELQADMADKRYGTDRSYTNAVEEKLRKSKNF